MNVKTVYRFGRYQPFVSDKMRQRPKLGRAIYRIFGFTNLATYGRHLTFKRLLTHVPLDKMKSVLDLGCGQGEFSFMIAEAHKNVEVDAVDIDSHAVAKIREVVDRFQISNMRTFTGTIDELQDNYYDLIFTVDVFQHIPVDQMPFKECYNKLKKGGYLITKMPNKKHRRILPESWFREFDDTLKGTHSEHNKTYIPHFGQVLDLDELVRKYKENGFNIVAAFYSDGLVARAAWEFNYLMTKAGAPFQLLSLPLLRVMMRIDNIRKNRKRGNYIQVVGQKV